MNPLDPPMRLYWSIARKLIQNVLIAYGNRQSRFPAYTSKMKSLNRRVQTDVYYF